MKRYFQKLMLFIVCSSLGIVLDIRSFAQERPLSSRLEMLQHRTHIITAQAAQSSVFSLQEQNLQRQFHEATAQVQKTLAQLEESHSQKLAQQEQMLATQKEELCKTATKRMRELEESFTAELNAKKQSVALAQARIKALTTLLQHEQEAEEQLKRRLAEPLPPVQIAHRGHSGRHTPQSTEEQDALTRVMSNPKGKLLKKIKMADKRWPDSEGWQKFSQTVTGKLGNPITIHYLGNKKLNRFDDFKFKDTDADKENRTHN